MTKNIKETVLKKEDHAEFFTALNSEPKEIKTITDMMKNGEIPELHKIKEEKLKKEAPLNKLIRDTITAHMSNLKISDIRLRDDIDHDGDPLLRIIVLYNERKQYQHNNTIMAANASETTRVVRQILHKADDNRFPYIRFIDKKEADEIEQNGVIE